MFHLGGKEILRDDEQESPHDDEQEESPDFVWEIHLFVRQEISFARGIEACEGEELIV